MLIATLALCLQAQAGDTVPGAAAGAAEELPPGGALDPVDLPPESETDPGAPIINGQDADEAIWPQTGGMLAEIEGYGVPLLMCSSTLIAPDVVLLAAHCIDPNTLGGNIQQLGWSRLADLEAWGTGTAGDWPDDTVFVGDYVANDGFSLSSLGMGLSENFDIGLLFLEEPVTDVDPAILPTVAESDQIAVGGVVTVVGWGYQDQNGTEVGIKQVGDSDISDLAAYEFQVGAATEAVRKCHGDSGGPSFFDVTTDSPVKTRLIGVTSHTWDETDCSTTGGVDTRVDYYLDWIEEEMVQGCAGGARVWCDVPGILPPPGPPRSAEEILESIRLVGCATAPGGGLLALLPAALAALGLRRRARP